MITQLSPLLARVSTQVKPEDLLLQKASWVYFSTKWPGTWKWCAGKFFEVSEEPVLVKYAKSLIMPGSDYQDLDLSNSTSGLKLYPENEGVLYQCAVGFKPGDYITHVYVPKDKFVYALAEATMYPDVTDADKLYLGALTPDDSPHTTPLLYLYFIKNGPSFYLRPYVLESVSYDKASIEFKINKCQLSEISNPTVEMVKKALKIPYYTDLVGF